MSDIPLLTSVCFSSSNEDWPEIRPHPSFRRQIWLSEWPVSMLFSHGTWISIHDSWISIHCPCHGLCHGEPLIMDGGPWLENLDTKLIFHDLIKFSKSCPNSKTSLFRFNFIELPLRNRRQFCAPTFCRFHQDAVLILKAAETFINFTAISLYINFSDIISFKVVSHSACYLTNGDYIRYLL